VHALLLSSGLHAIACAVYDVTSCHNQGRYHVLAQRVAGGSDPSHPQDGDIGDGHIPSVFFAVCCPKDITRLRQPGVLSRSGLCEELQVMGTPATRKVLE
jgi:hypothetical protein